MQSRKDRLKTYQPAVIQDLGVTACRAPVQAIGHVESSSGTSTSSTWQARKAAQRAALEAQARVKEEAFHAAMQRKQQQVAEEREAKCKALYSEVLDGLVQGSSGILSEVQQVLDRADAVRQEQQVQLYHQWNAQVFERIQGRIKQGMSHNTVQQLEASLRAASDDYIRATNRKLGVFRDVIIESDYNPLKPLNNSIKVPIDDVVDPLKKDLLKAEAEKALLMVPGSHGSSSSSSGRHSLNTLAKAAMRLTLEVERWGEGQINATPYGHCIDEAGNYTIKRADPKGLQQTASHLYMDDYSSAASSEPYRPGKHMTQPVIKGGRKGLFDLLQGSCKLDPAVAGSDSWLQHKGKMFVAAPDVLTGRNGLVEVLQQISNPYEDGRALDDAWLQPSGKLKVPGPEQRRGRADPTEIIQQSSHPYMDGRSLGDFWLDHKGKRRVVPGLER